MKTNRSPKWLLLASCSFAIGTIIASTERFLWLGIDSLLPDANKVIRFSRPGTITILSSEGKVIQKIGPATQEKIKADKIPLKIKQAFIASEDRRFYDHKGVDLWGISRALITNIREKSVIEGGSTITQQLARIVYLSQDRTLTRKIKEAALSYKLERQLSKEKILGQYLNYVYLGSGAYGIADASWVYFSKTPEDLNLAEAALIAGLAPAPSLFSPLVNTELALKRRSIVLQKMYKENFISKNDFLASIQNPLNLSPAEPKFNKSLAPFFTAWLAQKLPEYIDIEQLELGGIIVKTSLRLDWQNTARDILRKYASEGMEGAMVSISPDTGLVRVLIGGNDFENNQFNRATQALRSPGSTFKIFPYLAAIEQGIRPDTIFIDRPKCWNSYCPKNFGNKYLGKISIAKSFAESSNTVAVNLLDIVGFQKVINVAKRLGVGNKQKLGNYYPLAIGAYEQTLLDMTAAYATIANRGVYFQPIPFEEIKDRNNNVLWKYPSIKNTGKKALDEDVADIMNSLLQEAVNNGTGNAAAIRNRIVAGKTGTSEGNRDLWFIGSIKQLTTGIWFGYDDNRETENSSGQAANVWKVFMKIIINEFDNLGFK